MNKELLSAVIQVLGGGIFGFLVAYATIRWQKKRKDLEYYYTWMPLLRFKPDVGRMLLVSVDKAALTGNPADKGTNQSITSAYGFSIRLRNAGNDVIETPNIEITLDSSAKIIEYSTKPVSTPDRPIDAQVDATALNRLNTQFAYLNPGDVAHIALISTENNDPGCCDIVARGKGVRAYPAGSMWPVIHLLGYFVLLMSAFYAINSKNLPNWISPELLNRFGGHLDQETVMKWPTWVEIVVPVVGFGMLMLLAIRVLRRLDPTVHKPWGTDT